MLDSYGFAIVRLKYAMKPNTQSLPNSRMTEYLDPSLIDRPKIQPGALHPEVWSTSNESRRRFAVFRPHGFFVFVLSAFGLPHDAANSRGVL